MDGILHQLTTMLTGKILPAEHRKIFVPIIGCKSTLTSSWWKRNHHATGTMGAHWKACETAPWHALDQVLWSLVLWALAHRRPGPLLDQASRYHRRQAPWTTLELADATENSGDPNQTSKLIVQVLFLKSKPFGSLVELQNPLDVMSTLFHTVVDCPLCTLNCQWPAKCKQEPACSGFCLAKYLQTACMLVLRRMIKWCFVDASWRKRIKGARLCRKAENPQLWESDRQPIHKRKVGAAETLPWNNQTKHEHELNLKNAKEVAITHGYQMT